MTAELWQQVPEFVRDNEIVRFSHRPTSSDTEEARDEKLRQLGDAYADPHTAASSIEDAEAITSVNPATVKHRPVLDLDFPAQLIPSTTPGHFHLYLDVEISHMKYMRLLDALNEAGILESGYVGASQERGYTSVRLPWVKKVMPSE